MKLFSISHDGGKDSGVTAYWLIECKKLFTISILRFAPNHRENYHSHAFNAITWWLKGEATEEFINEPDKVWKPSIWPKYTPRTAIHKYSVVKTSWAITFRGPWCDTWQEYNGIDHEWITLTHGRKIIKIEKGTKWVPTIKDT